MAHSTVRFLTLPLFASGVSMSATVMAQGTDAIQSRILRRIRDVPGAVVAVEFRDLRTGQTLEINPDTVFHAASTMKVPVMIEYFRGVDGGRIPRHESFTLINEFKSIVDGSPFSLTPGEDSDSALYQQVGHPVSTRQLVERMITRSSNLATNSVIARVGAEHADSTAHSLGAGQMKVLRGVEDGKAYQLGLNNVTTAPDLSALLLAIVEERAASPASCREMLTILSSQEFNDEIPAGLPKGTRVAHKTGWITSVLHDAAIVYPPRQKPYILVVLTKGIRDEKMARQLIVDISRIVWEHAVRRGA